MTSRINAASLFVATILSLVSLTLAGANRAFAVSCGTIAAPLPCSFTAGGTTTYTASNFQLVTSNATGGGTAYQDADVSIDIATGGGGTGLLTFSKNAAGPTPGIVFLANPGETRAFTFTYDLEIAPAVPGTVAYTELITSMVDSHAGNGFSQVQTVVAPESCIINTADTTDSCSLAGQPTTITAGNIVSLVGNSGNASIISFTNLFSASFREIPEPSSLALLSLGLAVLRWQRSR